MNRIRKYEGKRKRLADNISLEEKGSERRQSVNKEVFAYVPIAANSSIKLYDHSRREKAIESTER